MAAHLIEFAKRASSKVTRSLQVYVQMEAAQMGSVRMRSLTPVLVMRYSSSFGGASKRPPKEKVDKKLIFDVVKRKKKTQTSTQKQKNEETQNWFSRMKNVTDAMRQQSRTKNPEKARQKYYPVSATDTYKDWARMSETRSPQTMRDEPVHVVINSKHNELKSANEIALASVKQCSKPEKVKIKSESGRVGLKGDQKSQGRPVPETRLAKEMDDWLKENRLMLEKFSAVQNAALKLNESMFAKKPLESSTGNPRGSPISVTGSTAPKASSDVFGMTTSKDPGEINAGKNRLRLNNNAAKDLLRFTNETRPREEKGANELLEIRPRHVETIEDVRSKPSSKKSSCSATELSTSKRNFHVRETKSSINHPNINPIAVVKPQLSRSQEKGGGGLEEARKMVSVKNNDGMTLNKDAPAENKGFVLVGEANAEKTFGKNKRNFVLHDNPHVKKAERQKLASSKSETFVSSHSAPLKRSHSSAYGLKTNLRSVDKNGIGEDIVKHNTEVAFKSLPRIIDNIGKDLKGNLKKVNVFDAVGRSSISKKEDKEAISCTQVSNNTNVSPRMKDSPNGAPVTESNRASNSPAAARPGYSKKPGVDENELKANKLKDRLNDRILSHYRLTSIKNDKSVSLHGDTLASRGGSKSDQSSKSMNVAVSGDSKAVKSPKPIIDMMTGIQSKALNQFIKDDADASWGGATQRQKNVAGKTPKVPELKPEVKKLKKKPKKQSTEQPCPSRSEPQLRVKPEEVATSLIPRVRSAPDVQLSNAPRGSPVKKSVPASKFGTESDGNISGEPSPTLNTVDIGDEELWSAMVKNRMSNYERLASSPKSGPRGQSFGSVATRQTKSSQNFTQSPAEISPTSYNNDSSTNSSHTNNTAISPKTKTAHSVRAVANRSNQELIQNIRDQWGQDLRIKYPNLDKFVSRLRGHNAKSPTAQSAEKNCNSGVEKGAKRSGELFGAYNPNKYNHGLNTSYPPYKPSENHGAVNAAENTSSNARGDLTPPSTLRSGSKTPEVISSKSSVFSCHGDRKATVRAKEAPAPQPKIKGNYKIVPLEEWMKTRDSLIAEKMGKTSQENCSACRQHNLPRPGKSNVCDSDQDVLGLSASPTQSERDVKRYGKKSSERRDQMLKPKEILNPSAAAHDMYKDICETYMKAGGGASRSGRGVAPLENESGDSKGTGPAERRPKSAESSPSMLDVDSVLSQMQLNEPYRAVQRRQDRVKGARENLSCASTRKLFRGFDGMMDMTVDSVEDGNCQREVQGRQGKSPRSTCSRQPYSGDLCSRITECCPKSSSGYDGSNVPDANLRDMLAAKRRQMALEAQQELIHRCEDNIRKHESALERYRALLSMAQEEGIDIFNGDNSKRR